MVKTQYLSGTDLPTIQEYVQRTWESPDFIRVQKRDKRRVLIKDFGHPIGKRVFFDSNGQRSAILISTLKVVYTRNSDGNVVFITAYPLF